MKRASYENFWTDRGKEFYSKFLRVPYQLNHPIRDRLADEVVAAGCRNVLEVACASAIDYPRFAARGVVYTGVDITEGFVHQAKEFNDGIDVRLANARDLPFADGEFEAVYCKDLLEHQPPEVLGEPGYVGILREMWRVASKCMFVSFGVAPTAPDVHYVLSFQRKQSGDVWLVEWGRDHLRDFLRALPGCGSIDVIGGYSGMIVPGSRPRPGMDLVETDDDPRCRDHYCAEIFKVSRV